MKFMAIKASLVTVIFVFGLTLPVNKVWHFVDDLRLPYDFQGHETHDAMVIFVCSPCIAGILTFLGPWT